MMKKLFALLLAAVMLLGAGATALAAEPAGYDVRATDSSRTNSLTVGVFAGEGLKNGRLELTYPEGLILVSARGTLDAGAGITDLDASKPGTVHFAWAAYAAQKDAQLLQLTFPQLRDITAIYRDRAALAPRAWRQQVQDALAQHAFAAAGFAHDGEDLTRAQRKADVAHGLDLSRRGEKADGQIFYFQ